MSWIGFKPRNLEVFTIGLLQFVEHPALDNTRFGILDGLASEGFVDGENIMVDYKNAQAEALSV